MPSYRDRFEASERAFIDELATAFSTEAEARELLLASDYDRGSIPSFGMARTFWPEVIAAANLGKLEDLAALGLEALARFPHNKVFEDHAALAVESALAHLMESIVDSADLAGWARDNAAGLELDISDAATVRSRVIQHVRESSGLEQLLAYLLDKDATKAPKLQRIRELWRKLEPPARAPMSVVSETRSVWMGRLAWSGVVALVLALGTIVYIWVYLVPEPSPPDDRTTTGSPQTSAPAGDGASTPTKENASTKRDVQPAKTTEQTIKPIAADRQCIAVLLDTKRTRDEYGSEHFTDIRSAVEPAGVTLFEVHLREGDDSKRAIEYLSQHKRIDILIVHRSAFDSEERELDSQVEGPLLLTIKSYLSKKANAMQQAIIVFSRSPRLDGFTRKIHDECTRIDPPCLVQKLRVSDKPELEEGQSRFGQDKNEKALFESITNAKTAVCKFAPTSDDPETVGG